MFHNPGRCKKVTYILFGYLWLSMSLLFMNQYTAKAASNFPSKAENALAQNSVTHPKPQVGTDSDGDWVSDLDEKKFKSNPSVVDTDQDGLSDFEEVFIFSTNPAKADIDSDGDGIFDSIEKNLLKTKPKSADKDRDGDLVFDQIELDKGTDPGVIDTDGDMISDFLEIFLLQSDPRSPDPDNDDNLYPDIIQTWLPKHLSETLCEAEVTLAINTLIVNDAEEADSPSNIQGGDEAIFLYALQVASTEQPEQPISDEHFDRKTWQGNLVSGSEVSQFQSVKSMSAQCGQIFTIALQAIEDDSPWGGATDMGFYREDMALLLARIPFGWDISKPKVHKFEGVSTDSSYEYEAHYTTSVALGGVEIKQSATQGIAKSPQDQVQTNKPSKVSALINLLGMDGTEQTVQMQLTTQATATISSPTLAQTMTVSFFRNRAVVELPIGTYDAQIYAPPYAVTKVTLDITADGQKIPITLQMPALDLANLFFVDNILTDANTGQAVLPLQQFFGYVTMRDAQYLFRPHVSGRYIPRVESSGVIAQYYLDGAFEKRLAPADWPANQPFECYLSPDLRRAIYVMNNDFWMGDVDWETFQITNSHQVTQIGLFQYFRFGDPGTFYWYDDFILVTVAAAKPIRVNVQTGEVHEADVTNYGSFMERASPDGRFFISEGWIYDLAMDQRFDLPELVRNRIGVQWLTETRFALLNSKQVEIFEVQNDRWVSIGRNAGGFEIAWRGAHAVPFYAASPSGKYVFAWNTKNNILLDTDTGQTVGELTSTLDQIDWIDDQSFMFSRINSREVSIEDQGTWLYELTSGQMTKISNYPYSSLVSLPEKQVAVFIANGNLWRVNLDGSGLTQLTESNRFQFKSLRKPGIFATPE